MNMFVISGTGNRSNSEKMNTFWLVIAVALYVPISALAQAPLEAPNWDAQLALQTARAPGHRARLEELAASLRAGDAAALEEKLNRLIAAEGLSPPARDYILFQFATALGEAEAGPLAGRAIERLRSVTPMVLVPHPESAAAGVPLFNIRAAADGAFHLSLRRGAQGRAAAISGLPGGWIDAYLAARPAERLGFVDALGDVPDAPLGGILGAALERLPGAPELTPVAGRAALLLADVAALEAVVLHGGGSDLAGILEAARLTLPAEESLVILESALASQSPSNAALAIAQLYPALGRMPHASALLFDRLGDPGLGAAAAMALARWGDADTRARLGEIAQSDAGPEAARAASALDMAADLRGGQP